MNRRLWVVLFLLVAPATRLAHAKISTPDAAGYFWADAEEPFVDRSVPPAIGPRQVLDVANERMSSIFSLGFDFPFYSVNYQNFRASDNGWLTFDTTITNPQPVPGTLPSPTSPKMLLAAFWRDLEPHTSIDPYSYTPVQGGGYFRFAAQRPGVGNLILLHMVLYDTGCFKVWYQFVEETATASVGIQKDGSAGNGLQAIYLGSSAEGFKLENDAVIMFCPAPKLGCGGALSLPCTTPTDSTSPATLTANVTRYSCNTNTYLGRERVFVFDNPNLSTVTFALSNVLPTINLDLIVTRENKCSEYQCLAWGDTSVTIPLLPAGRYNVVVDGRSDLDNASFTLTATCEARGQALPCGSARVSGVTMGASLWDNYTCFGPPGLTGAEYGYEFTYPGGGNLRATLSNHAGGDLDLILLERKNLQPTACLAHADERMTLYDPPAGDYVIVVDGRAGYNGPFDLEVTCAKNLNCTTPTGTLTCQQPLLGTTRGNPNLVSDYSCSPDTFTGPEAVYAFTNPTAGTVAFFLQGPNDLSVQLISAGCNEGTCVASGRPLIARDLPAGNYYLVIDGKNGTAGDFSLTPICQNGLTPNLLDVTLAAGQCVAESKTALLSPVIQQVDLLFAIDVSTGQTLALPRLDGWATMIIDELTSAGADVRYGLVSFADYDGSRTSCGTHAYGAAGDYPYRRDLAITNNRASLSSAFAALVAMSGGDLAESYTRTWFETYSDASIGWRPNARRVVLMTGDDVPHDCAVSACLGGFSDPWGVDPGRDGSPSTPDDLEIVPVITEVGNQGILPLFLWDVLALPPRSDGLNAATIKLLWDCWTDLADGRTIDIGGAVLDSTDVADIRSAIENSVAVCKNLTLRASTGFGPWLTTVTPPSRTDVFAPSTANFDIEICAPLGTPNGANNFTVDLVCDNRVIGQQQVNATVSTCVFFPMTGISGRTCPGDTQTLSGAGSNIPGCTGPLEFRWLDLFRTPVTGWATTNTTYAIPVNYDFAYVMQFRCQNQADCLGFGERYVPVTVSRPSASAGPDISTCQDQPVQLGVGCDPTLTYSWAPTTDLDNPSLCQPTLTPLSIPMPDPWIDYTVTAMDAQGCVATDTVRVTIGSGGAAGSVGNGLRGVRNGANLDFTWDGGATTARRYNVHRTVLKLDLDKTAYLAPKLQEIDASEAWTDPGAVPGIDPRVYYEVFGRACDGTSVIN